MSYIETTIDHWLYGWTDGAIEGLQVHLYTDADFAGCAKSSRSTPGVCLAVEGPRTKWPVAAMSKKHACVSISTPEAELVAGCYGLRCEGLPAKLFFDKTVGTLSAATQSVGSASAMGGNQLDSASPSSATAQSNTGAMPLVFPR